MIKCGNCGERTDSYNDIDGGVICDNCTPEYIKQKLIENSFSKEDLLNIITGLIEEYNITLEEINDIWRNI